MNRCDELQHGVVVYDLPIESSRDMHRLREEACIRSLDAVAAAAHRANKTELQLEQRLEQQTGDYQATLRSVLSRVIARIERETARELNAWRCPGGCKPGSSCARAAFRAHCVPSIYLW